LETIVAGIIKTDKEKEEDEEEAKNHEPTNVDHLKDKAGIPDFWKKCFKNNKMIAQIVREKDEDVFDHFHDLETEESITDKKKKITVTLHFSTNEWFTNDKLTCSIFYKDEEGGDVDHTEGTTIEWNDGKDLTKKKIKKKQKHKKSNETRTIIKTVPQESIFNVFTSMDAPKEEDVDEEPDEET